MKAGLLIVLISALISTLSAQTTEPNENLPPRVLRTAQMIGVRSQVEELVQLRSAPKRDENRELLLAQRLQGVVIASRKVKKEPHFWHQSHSQLRALRCASHDKS